MHECLAILRAMERSAPRLLLLDGRRFVWLPESSDHPVAIDGGEREVRVRYVGEPRVDEPTPFVLATVGHESADTFRISLDLFAGFRPSRRLAARRGVVALGEIAAMASGSTLTDLAVGA